MRWPRAAGRPAGAHQSSGCAGALPPYSRIQFTPDLLPSDITGSEIYQQHATSLQEQFRFRPGPVFGAIILADEINRASARVQSALLEAMEERHVTVAGKGWPLPEAQLDRLLMMVLVDYPSKTHEQQVMQLVREEQRQKYAQSSGEEATTTAPDLGLSQEEVLSCWREIAQVHVAPTVESYMGSPQKTEKILR